MSFNATDRRERALLIGVQTAAGREWETQESLDELDQLAATAGAAVAGRVVFRQRTPRAATFIGRGRAEQLGERVRAENIRMLVFDDDLSPAQGRNLENIIGARVLDRTQLILDIFARHARTGEGRLQVELAQLEYLAPRLKRMWTHLERQQGGIGLRGPGEKQLELDRRRLDERMHRIRLELEQVRGRRAEQRRGRQRHGWAAFALVGYTNAGKSTLMNGLTGAAVPADDKLFATLDPTTRRLTLPNRQPALLTDTVGFIRKLPHHLIESFKATLEEVTEADALVHVVDAAHPLVDRQVAAVENVLRELGVHDKPVVTAVNKIDLPDGRFRSSDLLQRFERSVAVSALAGEGLDELRNAMADCLATRQVTLCLRVPHGDGAFLAFLHRHARIFETQQEAAVVILNVSLPQALVARCAAYVVAD